MLGYTKLNRFSYCGTVRASNIVVHVVDILVINDVYCFSKLVGSESRAIFCQPSDWQGTL